MLSLLTCTVLGVIQCLVTLVNELLCYRREEVATCGKRGKYFSAGTLEISKDNQGAMSL